MPFWALVLMIPEPVTLDLVIEHVVPLPWQVIPSLSYVLAVTLVIVTSAVVAPPLSTRTSPLAPGWHPKPPVCCTCCTVTWFREPVEPLYSTPRKSSLHWVAAPNAFVPSIVIFLMLNPVTLGAT